MSFAFIGRDRHVHVVDAKGVSRCLTAPPGVAWSAWSGEGDAGASHSWPTWSPDGKQLACFRLPGGEGSVRVRLVDVRGIEDAEVIELGDRLPIYLHWSADGTALAVLSQERSELHLSVVDPRRIGRETPLAQGSPLFFTWAGRDVAAYVGLDRGADGRLELVDPTGKVRTLLPGVPGNFCAPVWLGDRLLYVVRDGEHSVIATARAGDASVEEVERVDGLVALILSPDGRHVARAIAPDGDSTPYRDLAVIDVHTGEVRKLWDDHVLAFLWAGPDALIAVQVDTDRNLLRWHRVSLDGTRVPIAESYPTRDLGFYLRFFEQYAQSHALVDPRGEALLVAGGVVGHGDPWAKPRIFHIALDGSGTDVVAEGVFAVWSTKA